MKTKVKVIVSSVIAVATLLVVACALRLETWHWGDLALWMALGLVGEVFWLRTPSGDSVHTLTPLAKLSAIIALPAPEALIVIYLSTGAGNIIFRRARWYRALYNASQFTLAGFMAAGVFALLGGQPFFEIFHLPGFARIPAAAEAVAQPAFLFAFFAASLALNLVNYTLMAWLMSAVTGRRAWLIWKENCLYSSELQTSFGLTLMTPLFVILYGSLGLIGMGILLLCLALVHQANRRHLAVTKALDNYIRSERMAAMGEMAEEIGRSLGANLEDLKVRSFFFSSRRRHTRMWTGCPPWSAAWRRSRTRRPTRFPPT